MEVQQKVILCLEGGYNCVSVAQSFVACFSVLLGASILHDTDTAPSKAALDDIERTAQALKDYWPTQFKMFHHSLL